MRLNAMVRHNNALYVLAVFTCIGLAACTGTPKGVVPVEDFDASRYAGTWYEVARLDHSFERGLVDVKAEYALQDDGTIRVINSGRERVSDEQNVAEGLAKFVGEPTQGHLKVSFFGPFYGSYIVFELDRNYRYAFVSGFSTDYLWLLARQPSVDDDIKRHFIERVSALGFDASALIWIDSPPP